MVISFRLLLIFFFCFISQLSFGQEASSEFKKIVTKSKVYRGKIVSITKDSIIVELRNLDQVTLAKADVLIVSEEDVNKQFGMKIELIDGTWLRGDITEISADAIKLKLTSGEIIEVDRVKIKSTSSNLQTHRNNYYSQPFYLPSAFASQKGNHYMRSYMGLLYDFNFGLTDRFDLSFGSEIISIISNNGDITPVFQIGAKYQLTESKSNINLGIGTKYAASNDGGIFMIFLPITLGDKRANFSFIPTYLNNLDNDDFLTMAVSFVAPLNDKTFFSSDLLYADEAIGGSSTLNFVTKKGISFGLGVFFLTDNGGIAPNASLTVPLSGKWEYH